MDTIIGITGNENADRVARKNTQRGLKGIN